MGCSLVDGAFAVIGELLAGGTPESAHEVYVEGLGFFDLGVIDHGKGFQNFPKTFNNNQYKSEDNKETETKDSTYDNQNINRKILCQGKARIQLIEHSN